MCIRDRYKTVGGKDIPLATSLKKTVTPFCNNVADADDYTNSNPSAEVTNKDANMDGVVDVQAEVITISGTVSESEFEIKLIDEFGNKITGTVEPGEKTGVYTAFTASFPSEEIQGSIYSVEVSKDGYTKYRLESVPKDKLSEVTIDNAVIYAGDLDKDESVGANDMFLLTINLNKAGTAYDGDLDGDGTLSLIHI